MVLFTLDKLINEQEYFYFNIVISNFHNFKENLRKPMKLLNYSNTNIGI